MTMTTSSLTPIYDRLSERADAQRESVQVEVAPTLLDTTNFPRKTMIKRGWGMFTRKESK